MTASPSQPLPTAPRQVPGPDGVPRFGRFTGATETIDWARLDAPYARSAFWRRTHHKRWHYVALTTDVLFCGMAIVDLGWSNTAFAYAFDRRLGKEVAAYSQNGLPGLGAQVAQQPGQGSAFHWLGNRIAIQPLGAQRRQVLLHCGNFRIDAEFDASGTAPVLLAVGPICGGSVHATQKSPGMPLSGKVQAGGRTYDLRGGVASTDYSNGLLARRTAWRWASAHSLKLGFNLQDGYFEDRENALWLDGQLIPLAQARFEYDPANPLAPWHIHTDDGLLDLHFTPEGARRENKRLLIAASRYIQPVGTFSGWVKPAPDAPPRVVERLAGVTEDHFSRW
ncbi:MAG TPA: DUF2804 domain-containing protein [Noviherbaspirillum sp.]|uniref:DUF2804 domain-containing protein n=1 Tax=Noviherbaspirillum sp. TaxID=1926288 RepID=UPI002B49F04F|nr:DUF2804 domain-containing protein [Noviherbaspirillum sp.]HJV87437.1 DUF2804 domain-containing protein [Noviherbaspirillum sp.]